MKTGKKHVTQKKATFAEKIKSITFGGMASKPAHCSVCGKPGEVIEAKFHVPDGAVLMGAMIAMPVKGPCQPPRQSSTDEHAFAE